MRERLAAGGGRPRDNGRGVLGRSSACSAAQILQNAIGLFHLPDIETLNAETGRDVDRRVGDAEELPRNRKRSKATLVRHVAKPCSLRVGLNPSGGFVAPSSP